MTTNDLADLVADLTPAEWRAVLSAAAMARCIACGEQDGCECSDEVDAAKDAVVRRAETT